tara:strand:+ start:28033 stop:29091 length:1059 start_codon:yes stop_codon:yes gene_type:complete
VAVIHCFGAGLVGSYVARTLADRGHEVHVHDIDPYNGKILGHANIFIHEGDALETDLSDFEHVDIVVNMLPGDIGHALTTNLAEERYPTVDLSFSEQTPDRDDQKARDWGGRVLWDVGIAPGLSNMLLAEAYRVLGPLKKAEVRVGGNPTGPTGGWNYMAPFSPKDVIAEYTRPARVVRDGEEVSLPALSERHTIEVPERGVMEAFLTDGLRSVLGSIPAVEMSEYTVRWPGHIQKFIDERDAGTLDEDELLRDWWFNPKNPEFTWLEVVVVDNDGNHIRWEVSDYGGDDGSSMARTTGLVTVGCVEAWLRDPRMLPPGVHAPESLAPSVVRGIIDMMKENGVEITGPEVGL